MRRWQRGVRMKLQGSLRHVENRLEKLQAACDSEQAKPQGRRCETHGRPPSHGLNGIGQAENHRREKNGHAAGAADALRLTLRRLGKVDAEAVGQVNWEHHIVRAGVNECIGGFLSSGPDDG